MTKLNEKQIIEIFQKKLGNKKQAHEDVEIFKYGSKSIVVSVDTLVESTDVPPGMKIDEISRKSVAACVSDFAAKGTKPEFGIVSLTIPKNFSKKQIIELSKGFQKASKEFKVKILGGDTNEGKELSISVSLYGMTDKIIPRKGAKVGDKIFVTGYFGNTAAGLHRLLKNKKPDKSKHDKKIRNAFCKPKPKIKFLVKSKKYISSSMDSSDGLAKTLNEMSRQSKRKFRISKLPYEKELEDFSKKNKTSLEKLVLFGGEEYESVITISEKNISKVKNLAKKTRTKIIEIGTVESGKNVIFQSEGKMKKIINKGWIHLENS